MNLVGTQLGGRFELLDLLGEGGYGAVYRAKQLSMDRDVAIKIIHPHLAAAAGVKERFEREARVASRLTHPNTVVYFDFGLHEDIFFLAMEYVKGQPLADLLTARGPLPPERVGHLALQMLGALREAHELDMVHRDLKPANILLTRRAGDPDFVKVIDFGLAKIVRGSADAAPDDGPTQTGAILGTPAFMAPEQIRGEDLDGRADLYALGVILYLSLTGSKPFSGGTPVETAALHLTQPVPPLRTVNPAVPPAMEQFTMRLLAKARHQRVPSAQHAMLELAQILDLATPSGAGNLTRMQVIRQVSKETRPLSDEFQNSSDQPQNGPSGSHAPPVSSQLPEQQGYNQATLEYADPSGQVGRSSARISPLLVVALVVAFLAAAGTIAFVSVNGGTGTDERIEGVADGGGSDSAEGQPESADGNPPSGNGRVNDAPHQTERQAAAIEAAQQQAQAEADSRARGQLLPARIVETGEAVASRMTSRDTETAEASARTPECESSGDCPDGRECRRGRCRRERAAEQPQSPGRLTVNAAPWGVVYCNRTRWGEAPVSREVDPGTYTCTVRGPDGRVEVVTARVVAGETATELVRFE